MKSADASSPHMWSAADLGTFFVENRSEFLSHAKRVTRSHAEAEEIVQDSLVRVLLACPELESVDHARSYFHRVIENLGIDLFRRLDRQPRLVVLDDAAAEVETQWTTNPDYAEELGAANDAAIIREAISLLSPAERAALVMWEFEGRSTSEIARELGIKETSVRHTLARARARLRQVLSERIIDEAKGLTALDLLSVTYRKVERVAQESSKVALSLALVIAAFLGFNSLTPGDFVTIESATQIEQSVDKNEANKFVPDANVDLSRDSVDSLVQQDFPSLSVATKSDQRQFSSAPDRDLFTGLDSEGVPTGFTVTDSTGSLGILFSGQQRTIVSETGLLLSNIVSTRSGAANILIDQSIVLDSFGTSYVARVSAGINGGWQPLDLSYVSSIVERVPSGNYLLTVIMMVDSAVGTVVKVPTSTSGSDLNSAPELIATRILLDQTKTKILAQAVLVSADSQRDGA